MYSIISNSSLVEDLLTKYKIFPNYFGNFKMYNDTFNIGSQGQIVPVELLNLHELLLSHLDLKSNLLHPKFIYKMGSSKSITEICNDLDDKAREIYTNWNSSQNTEKKSIFELLEWVSQDQINQEICEKYFNWLNNFKPHILMLKFEDNDVKDAMFSILKADEDKIVAVSKIIQENTVEDLEKMISIFEKMPIEKIEKLKSLHDEIEEVGKDKVRKIVQEIKEEKRDFVFKKSIGNSFEILFKEYFESRNLGFVLQKMEDPSDFKISNSEKTFYVELKSYSPNNFDRKIRMSFKQGKGARDFKDNYALCILERPVNWNIDSQNEFGKKYFIDNTKVVLDIGAKVEQGVTKSIEFQKTLIDSHIEGVGIEFKDKDFKFYLLPIVWNGPNNLDDLFRYIITKLS